MVKASNYVFRINYCFILFEAYNFVARKITFSCCAFNVNEEKY